MATPVPYYRNFAFLLVVECGWALGTWLASPFTVMPNYLLRLGATPKIVGLLPAMWALGMGLGALLVGVAVANRVTLAGFTGRLHYLGAVLWSGLAVIAFACARWGLPAAAGLVLSLVLLFFFNLLVGFLLQVYFVLLSRALPEDRRGRWFGTLFSAATFVSLLGPYFAGKIIRDDSDLTSYAAVFGLSFLCFLAGTTAFFFLKEKVVTAAPRPSLRRNFLSLIAMWKANRPLNRYMTARVWLELGVLGMVFMATYSRLEGALGENAVVKLGTIIVLSHAGGHLVLGWVSGWLETRYGDARIAHLKVQAMAQALALVSLFFAVFGPPYPAAVFLSIAAGIRISAEFTTHMNILLETGPRHRRANMIALGTLVLTPAAFLIPLLGGFIIDAVGHRPVFLGAAVLSLPGIWLLWKECKEKPSC